MFVMTKFGSSAEKEIVLSSLNILKQKQAACFLYQHKYFYDESDVQAFVMNQRNLLGTKLNILFAILFLAWSSSTIYITLWQLLLGQRVGTGE